MEGKPEANAALIVAAVNALPALLAERKRLRRFLRETVDHISAYDDALGHSYCDEQAGEGWPCSCGFDDKMERWRSLLAEQEATDEQR
jgi:hypothetical protein